jgi:hypothetical protein
LITRTTVSARIRLTSSGEFSARLGYSASANGGIGFEFPQGDNQFDTPRVEFKVRLPFESVLGVTMINIAGFKIGFESHLGFGVRQSDQFILQCHFRIIAVLNSPQDAQFGSEQCSSEILSTSTTGGSFSETSQNGMAGVLQAVSALTTTRQFSITPRLEVGVQFSVVAGDQNLPLEAGVYVDAPLQYRVNVQACTFPCLCGKAVRSIGFYFTFSAKDAAFFIGDVLFSDSWASLAWKAMKLIILNFIGQMATNWLAPAWIRTAASGLKTLLEFEELRGALWTSTASDACLGGTTRPSGQKTIEVNGASGWNAVRTLAGQSHGRFGSFDKI